MTPNDLDSVAEAVVRKARQHGFVLPRQVREELAGAGKPERLWKDVLAFAGASLRYHRGRYYHAATVSERGLREHDQQRAVRRAVRRLVRDYRRCARAVERREQDRVDFIQPVRVRTEGGREFTLLSRDLSATGIRLLGTRRLLGQKVRVSVPQPGSDDGAPACTFLVRILWTCSVGDDLFENGGAFLEVTEPPSTGDRGSDAER